MPQRKYPHKRRHYFINKEFQFKFILKFCLLILAGVVVSTTLLLFFSQDTLTSSFQQSRLVIENTSKAILPALIYTSLLTLGLISFATIIVTLFVSHQIAGPLFRFEKDLKEIGSGNLTKNVRLRGKDQLTAMAESLNEMTYSLRDNIFEIQTMIKELLESASQQKAPPELIDKVKRIDEKIEASFII
jgi:methyl-accepting chemotaxis protein